jgi:hypothetical protein
MRERRKIIKRLVRPQHIAEPQYLEGCFEGRRNERVKIAGWTDVFPFKKAVQTQNIDALHQKMFIWIPSRRNDEYIFI